MKQNLMHWAMFAFIFVFAFKTVENPWTLRYLNELDAHVQTAADTNDQLYTKIKAAAKRYNEPAIDAVIHPVWKGIPGYNGLKVDTEASYENMKKEGIFDKRRLIFTEVEPDIHLTDLPPAPIYKGNPHKPMVAMMVNVAWGNEYLPRLLSVMDEQQVHATFFLDGSWLNKYPKLAKKIHHAGHEIGNHAYSHPNLQTVSTQQVRDELQKTNDAIERTLNVKPDLFTPPSGSYNTQVVKIADELDMRTILWTTDTIDWKNPRPRDMVNDVLQQVGAGSLILMHPTSAAAEGLEGMIDGIRSKGYEFGTVSDVLSEKRPDR